MILFIYMYKCILQNKVICTCNYKYKHVCIPLFLQDKMNICVHIYENFSFICMRVFCTIKSYVYVTVYIYTPNIYLRDKMSICAHSYKHHLCISMHVFWSIRVIYMTVYIHMNIHVYTSIPSG
jgi:hypothetical protein